MLPFLFTSYVLFCILFTLYILRFEEYTIFSDKLCDYDRRVHCSTFKITYGFVKD